MRYRYFPDLISLVDDSWKVGAKRELPEAESGVIEREARASSERQEKENHQRRRRIKEANWSVIDVVGLERVLQ